VNRRSLVLLVFLAAVWGSSYVFIKIGLDGDLTPAVIVFLRTALASLVLLPIAAGRGGLSGLRPVAGWIALAAVVQVVLPFLLISFGEQWISSGLTGVLVASLPVFTALLAPWLDSSEASSRSGAVGIVVGIAGVGLVLGVDLAGGGNALLGGLMVVAAALGYAFGGFVTKRHLGGVDTTASVSAVMGVAALIALPVAIATPPDHFPGVGQIAAMVALGSAGTGLAFVIFYSLIAQVGAARAALVTYLAPGFAVFYGVALYGEHLTTGIVAGLVLIVGGSWLAGRGRARTEAAGADGAAGGLQTAGATDR
jgi:drug/metabolite transporter (DMT)-like permease